MIGTIANTCTILIGSFAGGLLRRGLKEKYQTLLYVAMGLAATGLGINAVVSNMGNSLYPVLFIASLALGGLVGTAIDIEGRFDRLVDRGSQSSKKAKAKNGAIESAIEEYPQDGVNEEDLAPRKSRLSEGLSTAIVLFCFGTLSILGPINSALYGDETFLFTNATLDLVTSLVLASTYGVGIAFAAAVLFCWQGSIFLLAQFISLWLTSDLMCEISIVGGFLILASGLSILEIKKISVMNFLPALLIPPIWFGILALLPIA